MWSIKEKFSLRKRAAYLGWRLFSIVVVGIMAGSVIVSSYFIYENIYRTLADANTVVILSSTVGIDAINITEYDNAERFLALKRTPFTISKDARNIFMYDSSTSTASTSSTKK